MGSKLAELENEYNELIETCDQYGINDLKKWLETRKRDLDKPLYLMIVGDGNSGKSSLINALMGRDIAPVNSNPLTWCIQVYCNSDDEEYAQIVYGSSPNEFTRCSIEEALDTLSHITEVRENEMIRSRDKSKRVEYSEGQDIIEIWWYINATWPNDDFVLIDTPGMNQVRPDTGFSEVVIDGVEGIQIKEDSRFEDFYNRADIVFWCFDHEFADDDSEIAQKLDRASKYNKDIYGIVTMMDKGDDPETTFAKIKTNYEGKYLKRCIPSKLPPLLDGLSKEELKERKKTRDQTISRIKATVSFLKTKSHSIKTSSVKNDLAGIRKLICMRMSQYVDFYFENYDVYRTAEKKLQSRLDTIYKAYISELNEAKLKDRRRFTSRKNLRDEWEISSHNPNMFSDVVGNRIQNGELGYYARDGIRTFSQNIGDLAEEVWNSVVWKDLLLSNIDTEIIDRPNNVSYHNKNKDIFTGNPIDASNNDISIETLIAGAINMVADFFGADIPKILQNYKKTLDEKNFDKVFNKVSGQIQEIIDDVHGKCETETEEIADGCRQWFHNGLNDALKRQTGYNEETIENRIIDIEKSLYEIGGDSGKYSLYPYISDGEIRFFESKYMDRIGVNPGMKKEIGIFIKRFVKDYLKEISDELYNDKIEKIRSYEKNGIPIPGGGSVRYIEADQRFDAKMGRYNRINWQKDTGKFNRDVDKLIKEMVESLNSRLLLPLEKAQDKFVADVITVISNDIDKGIRLFTYHWMIFVNQETAKLLNNRIYSLLPPWDYYDFYTKYYVKMFPSEKVIGFLHEYEKTGNINDGFISNYKCTGIEGEMLTDPLKKALKNRLRYIKPIGNTVSDNKKAWDNYMEGLYASYAQSYIYKKRSIEDIMKTEVSRKYIKYVNTETDHKLDVLQFAVKCGAVKKDDLDILSGKRDPFPTGGKYLFSDGCTFFQRIRREIKENKYETD